MSKYKDFINKLVLLKDEAGRLGLFETMHELDAAVKKAGWETADVLNKQFKEKSKLGNSPKLSVGQIWKEVDPRLNRTVQIVALLSDGDGEPCTEVRIKNKETGRITKANPARFNGKSKGYKLIQP